MFLNLLNHFYVIGSPKGCLHFGRDPQSSNAPESLAVCSLLSAVLGIRPAFSTRSRDDLHVQAKLGEVMSVGDCSERLAQRERSTIFGTCATLLLYEVKAPQTGSHEEESWFGGNYSCSRWHTRDSSPVAAPCPCLSVFLKMSFPFLRCWRTFTPQG